MDPRLSAIRPGDEVFARSTGRRMVVRSIDGDRLHCTWFDGHRYHEVAIARDAVRAPSGTRDGRIVTI